MPFDNPNNDPFGDVQILIDARSRVGHPDRWLKGNFKDGDRHCLVAAVALACGNCAFRNPGKLERKLCRILACQLSFEDRWWGLLLCIASRQRLIAFNDGPRTRHEDVMALFDRAIERLAIKVPVCVASHGWQSTNAS